MKGDAFKMLKRFAVFALVVLSLVLVSGLAFSAQPTLNVICWGKYFNPAIADDFEKQFNCTVKINEVVTYDEVFNLLKKNTMDVVITGELAYPDLIKGGMIEKLDKSLIPNIKNLDPLFKGLSFDPGNVYSLPYHYIYFGIAYNKKKVSFAQASSLATYFENSQKLKIKITAYPVPQIMRGMALKYLGKSANSKNPQDLEMAQSLLKSLNTIMIPEGKSLKRGIYDYLGDLTSGKADITIGYVSGPMALDPNLQNIGMLIPKEGGFIATDDMAIVKGAPNRDLAYKFINYMYDPKVAAKSVAFLRNPFPVKGVKELLPVALQKDPILFPATEIVKKLEFPEALNKAQADSLEKMWMGIFGK